MGLGDTPKSGSANAIFGRKRGFDSPLVRVVHWLGHLQGIGKEYGRQG